MQIALWPRFRNVVRFLTTLHIVPSYGGCENRAPVMVCQHDKSQIQIDKLNSTLIPHIEGLVR